MMLDKNTEIFNILIEHTEDINSMTKRPFLFFVLKEAKLNHLKLALDKGAEIHTKDIAGRTILDIADDLEDDDEKGVKIKLLVKYGAKLDPKYDHEMSDESKALINSFK